MDNLPIKNSLLVHSQGSTFTIVDNETGVRLYKSRILAGAPEELLCFLGIIKALFFIKKENTCKVIYCSSYHAISWIRYKKCYSHAIDSVEGMEDAIVISEKILKTTPDHLLIVLKWDTVKWGEIPSF